MSEFADIIYLLKTYGPLILVTAFVLWQSWSRELRLSARITALEDEMRNVVIPLIDRTSTVIAENSAVLREVNKHL